MKNQKGFRKSSHWKKFIRESLAEDIGSGDLTSLAVIPKNQKSSAKLLIKENGVLAGIELAQMIFHSVDKNLKIKIYKRDRSVVRKGEIVFEISGNTRSILKTERLVLNCMQRMSGIATLTRKFCENVKGFRAKITDTRKTTPLNRMLEKWAVQIGGGVNHRYGLFDAIIIKDNHADSIGGIKNTLHRVQKFVDKKELNCTVIAESRNLNEVKEILKTGIADRIMLDNMKIPVIKKAVQIIGGRMQTEASGGINLKNVRQVALTGVDFISVGALTHSVKSLDMSLKVKTN